MWNDKQEKKCCLIGDRAGALVWLANESALYYTRINRVWSVVLILTTYLLGSSGIPILFATNPAAGRYGNLIIQVLIIILGVIETLYKAIGYEAKITHYNWVSGKNSAIFHKIRTELSKVRAERSTFNTFHDELLKMVDETDATPMKIPPRIYHRYQSEMGVKALSYEELFVQHIEINEPELGTVKGKGKGQGKGQGKEQGKGKAQEAPGAQGGQGDDQVLRMSRSPQSASRPATLPRQNLYEMEHYHISSQFEPYVDLVTVVID